MLIFKEVFVLPRKQKLLKLSQRKGTVLQESDEDKVVMINP